MLRVYSILYLEKIWTRPLEKPAVNVREPPSIDSSFAVEQILIDTDSIEETREQASYGTVQIVSIQEESQRTKEEQALLQIEQDLLRKEKIRAQEQKQREEEQWLLEQERRKKEKQLKEQQEAQLILERQQKEQLLLERQKYEQLQRDEQEIQQKEQQKNSEEDDEEIYSSPSTPTPSTTMGDLSCSNSSTNLSEKQLSPMPLETSIHPYASGPHDYYDDTLSSDNEHLIDQLPTPPSTPNKFSPKRILHRARSSITDESVRNLGRRTSMFIEKKLTPTTHETGSIKSLRRHSSKLSVKGKTLGKKLKKVLSFQQT